MKRLILFFAGLLFVVSHASAQDASNVGVIFAIRPHVEETVPSYLDSDEYQDYQDLSLTGKNDLQAVSEESRNAICKNICGKQYRYTAADISIDMETRTYTKNISCEDEEHPFTNEIGVAVRTVPKKMNRTTICICNSYDI